MANRKSTPRVAIYARVSTTDQSTDSQLLDLRRYVADRGWHLSSPAATKGSAKLFSPSWACGTVSRWIYLLHVLIRNRMKSLATS